MSNHVFKVIALVGSSMASVEAAIQGAVARAEKTVRNLRWFEVIETRGAIENGRVQKYQGTLKVGFTMDA